MSTTAISSKTDIPYADDEESLAPGEKWVASKIFRLESELLSNSNLPHGAFQDRLKHLFRIPDTIYTDMLENVRLASRIEEQARKNNLKRHLDREKDQNKLRDQKKFYVNKVNKSDKGKSRLYRTCFTCSRRIAAYFKYFIKLSAAINFLQIATPAWALIFWHYCLYLQIALGFGTTAFEISINQQMSSTIGPGSQELLGSSQGLGIAACTLYFAAAIVGWIAARLRSRCLCVIYMISVLLVTSLYVIYTLTEEYDSKGESLSLTLAEKMPEFLNTPNSYPYIDQMQIEFACCGGFGPNDYVVENSHYTSGAVVQLPVSCCLRPTSSIRERASVTCSVQQGQPWPFKLNTKGCGQQVANYLIPTQSVKNPLCVAIVYMCTLSVLASATFFHFYKTQVGRKDVTEAKLTLGEKLLAILDIQKLTLGDNSDATVDILRRRIAGCSTIPEVIQAVMEMVDEVEDLLYVNPDYLAKLLMGVKTRELNVIGPLVTSDHPTKSTPSAPYLQDRKLKVMAKGLLRRGVAGNQDLLRQEMENQNVQFKSLFLTPQHDKMDVSTDPNYDFQLKDRKVRFQDDMAIKPKRSKLEQLKTFFQQPTPFEKRAEVSGAKDDEEKHPSHTTHNYFYNDADDEDDDDFQIRPSMRRSTSAPGLFEHLQSLEAQTTRRSMFPTRKKSNIADGKAALLETYQNRLERLLADVIKQSQMTVRNMRKNTSYMHPMAFSSSKQELIPHATKLLETITHIRTGQEVKDEKDPRKSQPIAPPPAKPTRSMSASDAGLSSLPTDSEFEVTFPRRLGKSVRIASSELETSAHQLSRVSGKVLTASQADMQSMIVTDPMEHIQSFHPEQLEKTPGRLDVGLRNYVANMKDTEH